CRDGVACVLGLGTQQTARSDPAFKCCRQYCRWPLQLPNLVDGLSTDVGETDRPKCSRHLFRFAELEEIGSMRQGHAEIAMLPDGAEQKAESVRGPWCFPDACGEVTSGPQHPVHLGQCLLGIRQVNDAVAADHGIEACRFEGQSVGIALLKPS